jgi:phage terminase small subunit
MSKPPANNRPYVVSRSARKQRQSAPLKHGLYRTKTGLPRQDRRRLAHYENELLQLLPWLEASDASTVRSFCYLLVLRDKVMAALSDQGLLTDEGEVRRLASELRQTLTALLHYGRELGLTPASRASLGLMSARGRAIDLAIAMSQPEDEGE